MNREMSKQAQNITVTQQVFAAFGAGDIPEIISMLDQSIEIEFYGPDVIPYAGHYRGTFGGTTVLRDGVEFGDYSSVRTRGIFGRPR